MLGLRHTTPILFIVLIGACAAPRFQDLRTPSGEFCSDMHVYPAGTIPEREYHRLGPIQGPLQTLTEAQRLESLRKAACAAGGDAVIEAVSEDIKGPDAVVYAVASGTAVTWVRRSGETGAKPITVLELNASASAQPESSPPPPQPSETTAPPPPPPPSATPSAKPTAAPAPTAKPKVVPFGPKPITK